MSVRLSPDELAAWRPAAHKAGHVELASWVRRVVNERLARPVNGDVPKRKPLVETDRMAYRHLAMMASNINQMARLCNNDLKAPDPVQLTHVIGRVGLLIDYILGLLPGVPVVEEPAE